LFALRLSAKTVRAITGPDKMRLIDPSHPFLRPAWRRYVIVAAPFIWAGVEISYGSAVWAYLCAGIGGFLAWHLVWAWKDGDAD
jgi:hypothetical protein